jgi:hypothetical protein
MNPKLVDLANGHINRLWNERNIDESNLDEVLQKMEKAAKGVLADSDLGKDRFDYTAAFYQGILKHFPEHQDALDYLESYTKQK